MIRAIRILTGDPEPPADGLSEDILAWHRSGRMALPRLKFRLRKHFDGIPDLDNRHHLWGESLESLPAAHFKGYFFSKIRAKYLVMIQKALYLPVPKI